MSKQRKTKRMPVVFDLETGDPDDIITLVLLCVHTKCDILACSVFPGGTEQIGFVKALLRYLGVNIPVGRCRDLGSTTKKHLNERSYARLFPDIKWQKEEADGFGHDIFAQVIKKVPNVTIITGAPLENVANTINKHPDIKIKSLFSQGGFAGSRCIPEEHRLPKFKDKEYMHTWNFGGNLQASKDVLASDRIEIRHCISKDVCHGVHFTADLLPRLETKRTTHKGWDVFYKAMEAYLKRKPAGKLMHDPLAATAALEPAIIEFMEVEMTAKKSAFGSEPKEGTRTWISVRANQEIFHEVLFDEC